MAITPSRGFTLIIALVLMTVLLSFGVSLSSLAFKQHTLTVQARDSQAAFYNADTALECALYADQQAGIFDYAALVASSPNPPASIVSSGCIGGGYSADQLSYTPPASGNPLAVYSRIILGTNDCADVQVVKQSNGSTTLFAQGYNVSCALVSSGNTTFVNRGILTQY